MLKFFSGAASIGILFGIYNLALIPYLRTIYNSTYTPAQLITIGMLSVIIVNPIIGFLSDRLGKRSPFIFGLSLTASLSLWGLTVPNKFVVSLSTIMLVMSTFSLLTPYSALIGDYSSISEKDRNYGITVGIMSFATFATSLFLKSLYDRNPKITFQIISVAVIMFMFPTILYARSRSTMHRDSQIKGSSNLISFVKKYRGLLVYFALQVALWFSLGGLFPYLTSFLNVEIGMKIGEASIWIGLFTLLNGLFSIFTGIFSKKIGQRRLLFISLLFVMGANGIIVFLYHQIIHSAFSFPLVLTIFSIFGIFLGFVYALNSSLLSTMVLTSDQGKAFGMSNTIVVITQAVSIGIMGYMIDVFGYRYMFLLVFFGLLISCICALYLLSE